MDALSYLAVGGAAAVAGAVNTIAGAGSLLTYPVLVGVGLSPLAANVTNDLGVFAGNVTGAYGLREELRGQRPRLTELVPLVAAAALIGGALLLAFPARSFELAAPVFLLVASLITAVQPRIAARVAAAGGGGRRGLLTSIGAIGVYGGYFGTGIGVMFFAALGVFLRDSAPRLNATKQILAGVSNGVAGILFAFTGPVHWWVVLVMTAGSALGGPLGARMSKLIPADALRIVVSVTGVAASVWLMAKAL